MKVNIDAEYYGNIYYPSLCGSDEHVRDFKNKS